MAGHLIYMVLQKFIFGQPKVSAYKKFKNVCIHDASMHIWTKKHKNNLTSLPEFYLNFIQLPYVSY